MRGLTIGSLFSGIGGLELGIERATGARTIWQVEQDEWCRRVLARHWPEATRFDDVRTATALPVVDIMCGGFPCQDISNAGRKAGIDGERSGLWREYARIIGEVRPRVVVVENVAALAGRGLARVIGDLARLGYVGSWDVVSAASVGAPHLRRRLFIVAADADRVGVRPERWWREAWTAARVPCEQGSQGLAADSNGASGEGVRSTGRGDTQHAHVSVGGGWCGWAPASAVRRMDARVPKGLDRRRLKALGNAVVPQVAEVVGHVVAQALARDPVTLDVGPVPHVEPGLATEG